MKSCVVCIGPDFLASCMSASSYLVFRVSHKYSEALVFSDYAAAMAVASEMSAHYADVTVVTNLTREN